MFFNVCLHLRSFPLHADWQKSDSSVDGEPQGNWRRSCKLSFLFPPRRQSAPESLLAGYFLTSLLSPPRICLPFDQCFFFFFSNDYYCDGRGNKVLLLILFFLYSSIKAALYSNDTIRMFKTRTAMIYHDHVL